MARFKNTDRADSKRQAKRKDRDQQRRVVRSMKYSALDFALI